MKRIRILMRAMLTRPAGCKITNHGDFKHKSDKRTVKKNTIWEEMIYVLDD